MMWCVCLLYRGNIFVFIWQYCILISCSVLSMLELCVFICGSDVCLSMVVMSMKRNVWWTTILASDWTLRSLWTSTRSVRNTRRSVAVEPRTSCGSEFSEEKRSWQELTRISSKEFALSVMADAFHCQTSRALSSSIYPGRWLTFFWWSISAGAWLTLGWSISPRRWPTLRCFVSPGRWLN